MPHVYVKRKPVDMKFRSELQLLSLIGERTDRDLIQAFPKIVAILSPA